MLDYIDFGSLDRDFSITTGTAKLATSTPEYTLEFWVYIYNYKSDSSLKNGEIQFNVLWDHHAQITITTDGTYNFIAQCYPSKYYSDFTASQATPPGVIDFPNVSDNLPLNPYVWNYVRCSVDQNEKLYTFKTEFNEKALQPLLDPVYDFSLDVPATPIKLYFLQSSRTTVPLNWGMIFL